jgi:hypothetical protein
MKRLSMECARPTYVPGHATVLSLPLPLQEGERPCCASYVSEDISRHSTASHLLRVGVDINTIRAWLGHVSSETSNRYAEADLEMKAKALATCAGPDPSRNSDGKAAWRKDRDLLAFLTSL